MTWLGKIDYKDRYIGEWLHLIRDHQIALPIFQRGETWDPGRKEKLLEAILQGRPVGILMILACQKGSAQVKTRNFGDEANKPWSHKKVTEQVLDGQQRLVALKEMLENPRYFIEIKNSDIFASESYNSSNVEIGGVVYDKAGKYVDDPAKAYSNGLIPTQILCPQGGLSKGEEKYGRILKWRDEVFNGSSIAGADNVKDYIKDELYTAIASYTLHYCLLPQDMSRDQAIDIFIDTNQNGIPVTRFEIIAAQTDQRYQIDIRKSLDEFCNGNQCKHIHHYFVKDEGKRIKEIGDWILKISCLLHGKDGKPPKEINFTDAFNYVIGAGGDKDSSEEGTAKKIAESKRKNSTCKNASIALNKLLKNLDNAFEFVAKNGIATKTYLGNDPAIYVIAALQETLNAVKESKVNKRKCCNFVNNLISAYFWRTFLSERYVKQANVNLHKDFVELKRCIDLAAKGTHDPDTRSCAFLDGDEFPLPNVKILGCLDNPSPWPRGRSRQSRALAAVMLSGEPVDWGLGTKLTTDLIREDSTGKQKENLDRHHIFPVKFLTELNSNGGHKIAKDLIDHGMNCAFLAETTNRGMEDKDPATYIGNWTDISEKQLKSRIVSHYIPFDILKTAEDMPEWYGNFIQARAKKLAEVINDLTSLKK